MGSRLILGARKTSSDSSSLSFVPCALTPQQEEPYLKLGVAPGASPEAVKRAYKRMAKQFHPDVCSEPDAATRFNDIKVGVYKLNPVDP
jgi:DnaJ-class molecular chaperone